MIARLREALDQIADGLGLNRPLLQRARRRYRANRKRAYKANEQRKAAAAAADDLRFEGHPVRAERKDKKALRLGHVAFKNHQRAIFWRGRVKVLVQRIKRLETRETEVKAELAKLGGVQIEGNKAKGGSPGERFRAVCLRSVANCASGKRRNFYSMPGSWDIKHTITPGEEYGERSDCSQTVTGWCWSADLPDPNGLDWTGGWTGSLVGQHNGWKRVSEAAMKSKGWGYVVYGGGSGHHVEAYIGPGERTAGHGSAPVDFGVIDLFGDGDYRCYIYDPD